MSDENNQVAMPTREDIRAARHAGFDDSVVHMEDERRGRLTDVHRTQDARRETNVSGFYNTVMGDGSD